MTRNLDLNPVTAITTDAVGQPGQRVFYMQARRGLTTITIETEKEQVRALALGIHQFLEELVQRFPDRDTVDKVPQGDLLLTPPLEPEFKVGQMGLGYDSDRGPGRHRGAIAAIGRRAGRGRDYGALLDHAQPGQSHGRSCAQRRLARPPHVRAVRPADQSRRPFLPQAQRAYERSDRSIEFVRGT